MQHLWLIPAFPLAGFLANGIFGRRAPKAVINLVGIGAVALSFAWAVKVLLALSPLETAHVEQYGTWIQSGILTVSFEFAVDRLAAVMLMVVTGVGLVIHVYSIGYMAEEGGYYRFFSFMNLFMFFMLTLVLANNYLVMFVGWEGVGLCSYLLIGFYFLRKSASDAGNKAFIVNRIGDFGFSLAMFLMVVTFGTLDFPRIFSAASGMPTEHSAGILTAICLLLFLGATGKSAQIPLYVWLPDAMEGPTPVSALIHAATMVTAGVYMVARSAALFIHAPIALQVVALVGLATAFLAASIGLAQNDIKKVYAYSTISQLGYMVLALGVGAFAAGIFHILTHAFFKALLFLGAGSVIHALGGEQDLRRMGGLRAKTPLTFFTLLCASVAISGVPPFAGFFSKDEILVGAYGYAPWMYWVGVITAGMTSFYIFRVLFLTFFGKYRGEGHPHESPSVMTIPLLILAALSLTGGFIPVPSFLEPLFPAVEGPHASWLVAASTTVGLLGIFLAYLFYVARPGLPDVFVARAGALYRLVYNKYFVDEVYDATVVQPVVRGSRTVLWRGTDVGLIDGTVNGIGARARDLGNLLRLFQSGNIRSYATWVLCGSVILLIAFRLVGGGR